jgi:hypothetical protein
MIKNKKTAGAEYNNSVVSRGGGMTCSGGRMDSRSVREGTNTARQPCYMCMGRHDYITNNYTTEDRLTPLFAEAVKRPTTFLAAYERMTLQLDENALDGCQMWKIM